MKLRELVKDVEPEIYEVFCQLHRHPELAMQEYKTSALVEKELREKTQLKVTRVGKTGVLAELKGEKPGAVRCIGLRADMDALPITENPAFELRSEEPGLMHACGHDAHTSILLGTARVLEKYRDRLAGTVLFFFQPGEEPLIGAKQYLADLGMDLTKLDAVAACHVLPDLEVGKIGIRRGPMLASANDLKIQINGKQGHSSKPNEAIDPIMPAAVILQALQQLVTKEVHPAEPAVVNINSIHCGDEGLKIVPGQLRMSGSIKAMSPQTRQLLLRRIPELCENIAASMRCTADVEIIDGPPPLINDDQWTDRAVRVVSRLFGAENAVPIQLPSMCSEDFSYFMEKTKGIFVRIGSRTPNAESGATHNPNFCVDRGTLTTGMLTMAALALDYFEVDDA